MSPTTTPTPFEVDGVHLHPVMLSADDVEAYYEGFSNDTLWPLYHDAIRESGYHEWQWDAYVEVNQRFADTLAEVAPPDAIVWIHDYHLQLVPQMLREQRDDVRIGFFNHIPFPPYELFARIPWREEIVEGLLGADLLGFQRQLGAQNFIAAARRLLHAQIDGADVRCDDHVTRVGTFPISIDVEEFETLAAGRATRRRAQHDPRPPGRPGGDPARRRPARLHEGHRQPPPHVRGAARQPAGSIPSATCSCRWRPRPARASTSTSTSATTSSAPSVRSTAVTPGSAIRSSTTCTGRCRSTSSSRCTAPPTCCS